MGNRRRDQKNERHAAAPQMTHSQLQPRSFGSAQQTNSAETGKVDDASATFDFADIGVIQPKLTIGQPNDKYEQEADRVASEVVQKIHNGQVATKSDQDETGQRSFSEISAAGSFPLQRDGGIISGAASSEFESQLNQAQGGGSSLEPNLQGKLESAMGGDFSRVKVHTDGQADQLSRSIQAKAFTTGNDVFFKQGAYDPGSKSGQELIAHELTHVMQQNSSAIQRQSDVMIQREITDGKGKSVTTAEAIKFLTNNHIDADFAETLVHEHMKGAPTTLGTLLSIAREDSQNGTSESSPSPQTGAQNQTQDITMHDESDFDEADVVEEKHPEPETGNLLEAAQFLIKNPPMKLYRKIKQIWIDDSTQEDKHESERQQNALDGASDVDLAKEVGTICDFTAYGLMVGAVGAKQLEALKRKYQTDLYNNIQDEDSETETSTDANSKAYLYKPGDGDKLLQTWQQWKGKNGNSAMQVKFNHVDAGPHTFVVERVGGKVALYQSYLKNYTLEEYLTHAQEQIGKVEGGVLVDPGAIEQCQIHALTHGLGTAAEIAQLEQDKSQVGLLEPAHYKEAFGVACSQSKHYGEAINAVALLVFENCPMPGVDALEDVNDSDSEALGLVTNYIDILNAKVGSSESGSATEAAEMMQLARTATQESARSLFAQLSLRFIQDPEEA